MKIDHQFYTILMLQMVVEAIRLICQNITSLINPLLDKIELPEHVCTLVTTTCNLCLEMT